MFEVDGNLPHTGICTTIVALSRSYGCIFDVATSFSEARFHGRCSVSVRRIEDSLRLYRNLLLINETDSQFAS